MNDVVNLQEYRTHSLEQKAFGGWRRRFGTAYPLDTRTADLSDAVLYRLAVPGEDSAQAYYEIIMGLLGLGEAPKFYYLPQEDQLRVMDIHLFIADQIRFEMMARLGWLSDYAGRQVPLVEMVQQFNEVKPRCKAAPPRLNPDLAEHGDYAQLIDGDKDTFVRRLLPQALEAFKERLGL